MVTKDAANLKTSVPTSAGPYGSRYVEPFVDPATNPAVLEQQDYAELKRRIVPKVAQLCEGKRQEHCVKELHPEDVDDEEERDACGEEGEADSYVEKVVAWLFFEQPRSDDATL